MIGSYVKQINDLLNKIQEEDNENMETIIGYATSTELNVGSQLCRYGELYKLVFYSTSYEEVIQKLENLYKLAKYEGYEEDIKTIQDMFIKGIKEGKNFDLSAKMDVLDTLEHEYIFDIILGCL